MSQWLVLGISGITCGGKTTLAHSLRDYFKTLSGAPLWNTSYIIGDVQLISQDDYFLPIDDLRHKWIDKLNAINFELLTSLDMKQMLSDIAWTIKGRYLVTEPIGNFEYMREYDLATSTGAVATTATYTNFEHYALQYQQQYQHVQQQPQQQQNIYNTAVAAHQLSHYQQQEQQQKQQHQPQQLHQRQVHSNNISQIMRVNSQQFGGTPLHEKKINVLIIEGFLIFNQPELLDLCDLKFHLHLPYEKCFDRRRKRTYEPPDVTGYFEICVWPHYEKNFTEFRESKDITFLNGEIAKDKIFKYVLQRIVHYVDKNCENASPPPQKLIGMLGTVYTRNVCKNNQNHNNNNNKTNTLYTVGTGIDGAVMCPMEQQ